MYMEENYMRNPFSILPGFQKHVLYELLSCSHVFLNSKIINNSKHCFFQNSSPYPESLKKHIGDTKIMFFMFFPKKTEKSPTPTRKFSR